MCLVDQGLSAHSKLYIASACPDLGPISITSFMHEINPLLKVQLLGFYLQSLVFQKAVDNQTALNDPAVIHALQA